MLTNHAVTPPNRSGANRLLWVGLIALSLLVSACSIGSETADVASPTATPANEAEPTPRPTRGPELEPTAVPAQAAPEPDPEPTPTPAPETDPIQAVQDATLKVLVRGTSVPVGEAAPITGSSVGTAFFISEDGLALTNSHVIGGGDSVEVFLPGSNDPTSAELLGVSECSDLALIDVDGAGYPALAFRDGPVNPGLRIFAAGFPVLFDEQIETIDYTLTAGIVNTTTGSGETTWASVPNVIEHDARIRGGNSGGPLVDEAGQLVGVNFANEDTNDLNLAISGVDAQALVDELQRGDFESLGIDPDALPRGQGVWVSAVRAGSEAERLGILAGDVIVELDGVQLARDGTAEEYCEAIRVAESGREVSIVVARPSTDDTLRGAINGAPLVAAMAMTDLADGSGDSQNGAEFFEDFRFVSDDTGTISLEVPVAYGDLQGTSVNGGNFRLVAAPDVEQFLSSWQAPGLLAIVEPELAGSDIDDVMDLVNDSLPCDSDGERIDVDTSPEFTGKLETFSMCEGAPASLLHLAVASLDGDRFIRVVAQVPEDRDIDAFVRAVETLDVQFRDAAVVDALVADIVDDDTPLTEDLQEIRCIAINVHDSVGSERLTNAGILTAEGLRFLELTFEEDSLAVEAVFACVDVEELFVEIFLDSGISRDDAECIALEVGVNNLKEALVESLQDPDSEGAVFEAQVDDAIETCGIA